MPRGWRDQVIACREIAADLCSAWRSLIVFDLLCKLLTVVVLAPLSAWFLGAILRSTGDQAVSNTDLLAFFLSPRGLLLIVVSATTSFALLFFELGGLALIAVGVRQGKPVSALRTLQFLGGRLHALGTLALRQFLVLGAMAAAVLASAAIAKATFLRGGDIYYYVTLKPPSFWWAVTLVGAVALPAAIVSVILLVHWIFSVPVLLLKNESARGALAESRRLVHSAGAGRVLSALAKWAVAMLVITSLVGAFRSLVEWILLGIAGDRISILIAMVGLILGLDVILGFVTGMVITLTFAVLLARLFSDRSSGVTVPRTLILETGDAGQSKQLRLRTGILGALVILLGAAGLSVSSMLSQIQLDRNPAVTAHRAGSRAAPENTMAALKLAIEHGADYSEIDVQETADGVVVLLHDTDLRRVAGDSRSIWEVPLSELRELDVGSWFAEEFVEERAPALAEAIEAVRGRMKLNIEMKINGHGQQLEAEVARIVRHAEFTGECIVTSLNFGALQELARRDESLRRGLIVTASVGNPTGLDVDLLAVNARTVTRDLISRAHREGMEVHVWTVDDPEQMLTMIHMGVDNILTSSPDVLRELLDERAEMNNAEKMLLFLSDFLKGRL